MAKKPKKFDISKIFSDDPAKAAIMAPTIITDEIAFNVNSDFTISSGKSIELATNTTGGYVHITNTNKGSIVSENRALVVNGGVNNQKDMFIGANITVAGNLNVLDNYGVWRVFFSRRNQKILEFWRIYSENISIETFLF